MDYYGVTGDPLWLTSSHSSPYDDPNYVLEVANQADCWVNGGAPDPWNRCGINGNDCNNGYNDDAMW